MSSLHTQQPWSRVDEATIGVRRASASEAAWAERQRWRDDAARPEPGKPLRHADAAYDWFASRVVTLRSPTRFYLRRAERVLVAEASLRELGAAELSAEVGRMQALARTGRLGGVAERTRALAVVREAGRRAWGLSAYREQVAGAWALLDGRMTEMATGEGKTLVAALAAAVIGWRGRGCHVVTVNDYLAQRDAALAAPFFGLCGLRVGYVVNDTPPPDRAAAYAADVTYTTHQNAAADYLRDQLADEAAGDRRGASLPGTLARRLGSGLPGRTDSRRVMRGLEAALVDEADSVLLDEAVTPLIISGGSDDPARAEAFAAAAALAERFEPGRDFRLDLRHRDLRLTPQGERRIDELCEATPGPLQQKFRGGRVRREMLHQALTARHLFLRGDQYVVRDGKVVIVDGATGRLMPDRTWRAGLHQAVEAKEGVEVQGVKQTLASVSFQRFFRQYQHLAGTTGTAWSDRAEVWRTYRLRTVRVPTHRPCRRRRVEARPLRHLNAKWDAVVRATRQHRDAGRPVLIGTRSVEDSETLGQRLTAAGIAHDVLNAHAHEREAGIVADAGQAGRVTVATNMAGRGTDIKLGAGVADRGGLVVIATDRHDSPRVDRQLRGRAARQGEPGVALTITSLDDPLPRRYARRTAGVLRVLLSVTPGPVARGVFRVAQARAARHAAQQRRQVQLRDEHLAEQVSF
ncbi:MAG: hypothetical protein AAF800_00840 [Planctomycetota bacterium]